GGEPLRSAISGGFATACELGGSRTGARLRRQRLAVGLRAAARLGRGAGARAHDRLAAPALRDGSPRVVERARSRRADHGSGARLSAPALPSRAGPAGGAAGLGALGARGGAAARRPPAPRRGAARRLRVRADGERPLPLLPPPPPALARG